MVENCKDTRIGYKLNESSRMLTGLINSIFYSIEIGIAITDYKGKIVKANNSFNKLLGYKAGGLSGKSFIRLVLPSQQKEAEKALQQVLPGKTTSHECKLRNKKGVVIDVYTINRLYIDDNGNKYIIKTIRDVTVSNKYNELLLETEKATRIGGFEVDLINGTTAWTDELYNIYELKKDVKPSFRALFRYFPKERLTEIKKLWKTVFKKGISSVIEHEIITAKNKRKWVRATLTPVKLKSKVIKVFGTVQDIAEKKSTELEIERLSWVARHTNNGVIIVSKDRRIEWVNESFEKIYGYKLDELRGSIPNKILHGPQTDPVIAERIETRIRQQLPVSEVLINYRKDKKTVWIKIDIIPIVKDKKLVSFVGIVADLTDIIKAQEIQATQEKLMQSKRLLEAISKGFPDGMIGVIDQDLKYTYIGGSELKRVGHKREDFIGDRLFDKIYPEADLYIEPFLKRALSGERLVFEVNVKEDTYLVNAVPLETDEVPTKQVLVVIRNITRHKVMEEETLLALHKQKELGDLKSKFVSVAAHEFRTPLSTILSSNYLVAQYDKPGDEEKRLKHINRINAAVANLTDLINEFLSLDRIEDGKEENNPVLFNLTDYCNELIEEMRAVLKEGQTVIVCRHGRRHVVFLDKKHVRNVLINLISNAAKYSPEGSTIRIDYGFELGKLNISVSDEGIGIPEEDQKHLFEKFFRANNVSAFEGTGIGLHIVKRYMDMMGGKVTFKSKLNEGSTFVLHFPKTNAPDKITDNAGQKVAINKRGLMDSTLIVR